MLEDHVGGGRRIGSGNGSGSRASHSVARGPDGRPAKEKEMLNNFETIFRPAASRIHRSEELTYQSEELRQKWIASDVHQKVWPTIENQLATKNYTAMLFDVS